MWRARICGLVGIKAILAGRLANSQRTASRGETAEPKGLVRCCSQDAVVILTLVISQYVGLLGYPLSHSISPAFQQAAFDHYGMSVQYELWPAPPEMLESEVSKLRLSHYLGANVTVPHKERIPSLLDEIDSHARSMGAINTIVARDDRLIGYNTDGYGFIRSLQEIGGCDPGGKRVLLLGAGGAGRAAAFSLVAAGAASVTIANRTVRRAESLARDVGGGAASNVAAIPADGPALREAASGSELIVNSTSVGMRHGDAEGLSPLDATLIPPGSLVYDMVYNPPDTPLMRHAEKAGARTLGGLMMLIYQGAAAFELWTGSPAPLDVMAKEGQRALALMTG